MRVQVYEQRFEQPLLQLLRSEPDWQLLVNDDVIDAFRRALASGDTRVLLHDDLVCGYVRAVVDDLAVYISELYVAPAHRGRGLGKALLEKTKSTYPGREVYVLSDEDRYYEKLHYKRVGSIFQL